MRILFVDDDLSVRELLTAVCQTINVEFDVACCAEEALQRFKDETYAVCVTDLTMPGIDGVQLARIIRERYPETTLFAFTGGSSAFSVRDLQQNFERVFFKPSEYSRLIGEALKALALQKYPFLR